MRTLDGHIPRAARVRINEEFAPVEAFINEYVADLSSTGVFIKSKTTVCYEILRQLRRDGNSFREDGIAVTCNPEIADLLMNVEAQYIEQLEKRLQKKILIQAKKRFHLEKFEITGRDPENQNRPPRQEAAAEEA